MSLLDGILGQLSNNPTVDNLAAKVGLSPQEVEQAVAALGQAHFAESDTVTTAAQQTGLPMDKLQEIVGHIGGEGALGQFASLLKQDGAGAMLGGLKNLF
jgi:ATP phosphoribosyltransferase regulatory subunit HisZ